MLRTHIERWVSLVDTPRTLDEVADELFLMQPTQEEIGEVIDRLESRHLLKDQATPDLHALVRRVLEATRALRSQSGKNPSEGEVAQELSITIREVRLARMVVSTLSRPLK